MGEVITKRLTYANVMATMGVFLALGGVGYAAATVGSQQIVDNGVRSKDIRQRTIRSGDVRSNALGGKQVKEGSLGRVPDAASLQGLGPQAFERSGTLVRYSFGLGAGETREVLAHGSLKLLARCIDSGSDNNGAVNRDVARLYVSSAQDGALLSGLDTLDGGPAATDFLSTATAEADAVLTENSAPDGTVDAAAANDDDLGFAVAPDGSMISSPTGEALLLGVNVLGAVCSFEGWAILS